MGGATQRIEILLIGLILLLAGGVAAVVAIIRPAGPASYTLATPRPLATSGTAPISTPTAVTLATPIPTAAEIASAESTPTGATLMTHGAPVLRTAWPWLLLGSGAVGMLLIMRRRRRLGYTNQSVGKLLAAADAETRASNVRVMRDLAAQGLLTDELATAAGIDLAPARWRRSLRWPRLKLPHVRLPKISVPRLRRSRLALPIPRLLRLRRSRRHAGPITTDIVLDTSALILPAAPVAGDGQSVDADLNQAPALAPTDNLGGATLDTSAAATTAPAPNAWAAEDRTMAVAGALAAIWDDLHLHSPILALDTPCAPGSGTVVVSIDQHPAEEASLLELADRLGACRPSWRASWRRQGLVVYVPSDGAPPAAGGPLVVPILRHGRDGRMVRCFPLTTWRHLGLYGASPLNTLHALLSSLLYTQSPTQLALTILDHGEISPLYRDVPHLAPPHGDVYTTLEQLARALRSGFHPNTRPLMLVVVEPDAALLCALTALLTRLRTQPAAPIHLLLVQQRPQSAGRELYALLPALITSGGQGAATLLPGQGEWPKRGEARLVGRGMRLDGRPLTLDETAIAQMLTPLRGQAADLPPVLWDAPAPAEPPAFAGARSAADYPPEGEGVLAPTLDDLKIGSLVEVERTAEYGDSSAATATGLVPAIEPVLAPIAPAIHELLAPVHALSESADVLRLRGSRERGTIVPVLTPAPAPRPFAGLSPAILAAPTSITAPPVEPDNGWPTGPIPLGRVALAALLGRVVAAPAIIGGLEHERGLTKNRLVALLPDLEKAQARELAEVLMAWFDLAGLLTDPTRPGRLRHPRPLTTTDLAEIAGRLSATAIPDQNTVAAMWAEAHAGRS